MPIYKLKNPIIFKNGTGFTIDQADVELFVESRTDVNFSIGQAVGSGSEVQFNQVTANPLIIDNGTLKLNNDMITGSFTQTGDLSITENAVKNYVDDATSTQQTYLRKQFVKNTSSITVPSTASFTAVTASAPSGMTSTTENDFVFFINGQYMEHDAITIQQASSTLLLKVDNDSIGYDLESDDEILAIGKFNS